MILVKFLTSITLVLISFHVDSQSRYIKNYSVGDGLSQSEVSDIIEDKSGVFFLNTGAIGVDVFNGIEFKRIGLDDGLNSEFVLRLYKDAQGSVWFISRDGIDLYSKNEVRTIPFNQDVGQLDVVFGVAEMPDDILLIGTRKGLVEVNVNSEDKRVSDPIIPISDISCFFVATIFIFAVPSGN